MIDSRYIEDRHGLSKGEMTDRWKIIRELWDNWCLEVRHMIGRRKI